MPFINSSMESFSIEDVENIKGITVKQINLLKHTIGYDKERVRGIKHRRYEAYRNYFTCSPGRINYWESLSNLCEIGLMNKQGPTEWIPDYIFTVTTLGVTYLEHVLDVKIIMENKR